MQVLVAVLPALVTAGGAVLAAWIVSRSHKGAPKDNLGNSHQGQSPTESSAGPSGESPAESMP